jgi:hypothetical protein
LLAADAVHSRTTRPTKALLRAGMVGAGGVEPPSSSVSEI